LLFPIRQSLSGGEREGRDASNHGGRGTAASTSAGTAHRRRGGAREREDCHLLDHERANKGVYHLTFLLWFGTLLAQELGTVFNKVGDRLRGWERGKERRAERVCVCEGEREGEKSRESVCV